MARFEPFAGIRYDADLVALDAVTCPPYDVISEIDRTQLESMSPYNAVRVELSRDEPGRNRYDAARAAFDQWLAAGILRPDSSDAFYAYRMVFFDEAGTARHTLGVLGALGLEPPGGDVQPHERTMPKPKGDRLNLLRACLANLSPIWGLSPAPGLSKLCAPQGPPVASCRDEDGTRHELWRIDDGATTEAITKLVGSAPVIIADGHHRYETALAYQNEQRDAGHPSGPHDLIMAFVVELAEEQLSVRAIHRLLSGLPEEFDFAAAFEPFFDISVIEGEVDASVTVRMVETDSLVVVLEDRALWLRPRPDTIDKAEHELDSSILDVALASLPEHEVVFQHGWDHVAAAVRRRDAQAGILLRPARVDQIAETGRTGVRMPQKTTFFYPKPRTGLVFRRLR